MLTWSCRVNNIRILRNDEIKDVFIIKTSCLD